MNQFDQIIAALLLQAGGCVVVVSKETIEKIDPRAWIETSLPNPSDGSVTITYCTEPTSSGVRDE